MGIERFRFVIPDFLFEVDHVQLQPAIKTVPSIGESLLSRRFYAGAIYIRRGGFSNGTARKWGRMDATTGPHKRERPITGRKYKSRDRDMKIRRVKRICCVDARVGECVVRGSKLITTCSSKIEISLK